MASRQKYQQGVVTPWTHEQKDSLHGKTILLVHTGSQKKRFILQTLKKLGVNIVVLNAAKKSWAVPYVDQWILADTNNQTACVQAVGAFIQENPTVLLDGVITFWEETVLLTSTLADTFHWIGIPVFIAQKARNKSLFREFCQTHAIPAPRYVLIKKADDISSVKQQLRFPVVMKPVYGSASAFVIKVETVEAIEEVYDFIKSNIASHEDSREWDSLEVLVEEYIDGNEVDIDILLQNGKIKFWSITDNEQTLEPYFVETGQTIPSTLPEDAQRALLTLAEETLEKIGIQQGCIHFEAKIGKHGAVPIELNLRMGGDEVYSFVKEAWGVDLVEYAVKIATGTYFPSIKKTKQPRKYLTGKYFLPPYAGAIVTLDIDPQLSKESGVEEFHFYKKVGDPVLAPPQGYDYLGWVTTSGSTPHQAQRLLTKVFNLVRYDIVKFGKVSAVGKTKRSTPLAKAVLQKNLILGAAKLTKIRTLTKKDQRKLHIGIAGNSFAGEDSQASAVKMELTQVGSTIERTLSELGYKTTFFDFNDVHKAFQDLQQSDVDMVFNVCERINDSSLLEPHAASLLDILQIPYTGSNPFTLSLCIDKIRVKKILSYHNIPTPRWDYAYSMDDDISEHLKFPLLVKPSNTDNSIGVGNDSVVINRKQLLDQMERVIVDLGKPVLVEEYIAGDEYDVSIMGSDESDLQVLPLSRSIFSKLPKGYWHIYPYEAKWNSDSTYKKNIQVQRPPKNISKKLASLMSEIALDTYMILDCHDYGRIEIKVDEDNNPYILELNPNPSINSFDTVPTVAKLLGMDYGAFLEKIIALAIKRYKNKPPYNHLQATLG